MRMFQRLLAVSFFLLSLCSCHIVSVPDSPADTGHEAVITAVIDGDTISVRFSSDDLPPGCQRSERVRLIGVDTPELTTTPPEYYAEEARNFLNGYYLSPIVVEFDPVSARRDRYGRLLAYVYSEQNPADSLNWQLIHDGYGYYYGYFSFDAEKMKEFKAAEADARFYKRGLWSE